MRKSKLKREFEKLVKPIYQWRIDLTLDETNTRYVSQETSRMYEIFLLMRSGHA